ncbi:hypothetical protein INR49_017005, partial [Caranx melampygus]
RNAVDGRSAQICYSPSLLKRWLKLAATTGKLYGYRVMSSRKSSSTGEGLPTGKYGERTPLRSLENEMLHLSVPSSKLKSSVDVVKMTKGDAPVCDPEPHSQCSPTTKVIQTSAPVNDITSAENTCGLGDITFKSFVCPGGEIELSASVVCAEESIILPRDQVTYNPETEDTVISDSMMVQSCGDHIEHPYYIPDVMNASSVDTDTACQREISNATLASKSLDDKSATENSGELQNDCCGEQDVTWKSVVCDGGEVEVADVTRQHDETIPLPQAQLGEPSEDNSVNTTHLSVCGRMCEAEHADHPYYSSANGAPINTTFSDIPGGFEKPANGLSDVTFKSFICTGVASMLQFGGFSPVVRRASLAVSKARNDPAFDRFLADDSALGEKSLVAPVDTDFAGLWAEHLESPMPRPLLNSTALGCKPQSGPLSEPDDGVGLKPCTAPQSEVEKPVLDFPLIPDGPLQQQLRQMAEFLLLASGKMGPAAVCAPAPAPAVVTVPSPAETHSVCVGTSAVKLVDRSLNTSGQFERRRDFSVVDSCTLTDPLLWNVPPGSLASLPRQELEQRLQSSMIMVEALVQQLAAARAQQSPSAGPAPSELREKLVQTEHTELSQTTMHRDLYMEALRRISELELDRNSLQNLIQNMQDMRLTMTSLSRDTDAALFNMKEMEDIVREDHQSLVSHYGQMKSLFERTKETQTRMMQKVKDALLQRDDMRTQMEEAFTAKEAAFNAMEQLRTHCASEMSALEKSVGSQQELLAALNQAYPEQARTKISIVALNQAYTETLDSASELLSQTMEEQSSLMRELCTVRGLLQKTAPMLLKLNEKAAAALRERDEHISAKNQAVEEREQIEEELNEANVHLQTAREQIGDLNLQVTILSSEMGVLRQKLTEQEEEKGQLERKVTELSATVSSTLASYTFLEQALASETTKLQQSWKDIQQATDRANELEASLGQSEQRVCELSRALSENEEQLTQLQTLSQSQEIQIQQLQEVCTQLGGVREMNEFLQMENELAREQVAESERMLRTNLQGLRERNIQCEDLKGELGQLQLENKSLQQQLETTRSRASTTQLELREKLAQAVTEITLLHHTLRGLTNELHAALNDQKADKDIDSHSGHNVERRHPSSSFVDSIMVALTAEKEEDIKTETPPGSVSSDTPEPQCETLFSEMSAFTRITAVTPKKSLYSVEVETEEEDGSSVAELLVDLGSTVTELASTLKLVEQHKDAQLEELHNTIYSLQEEQQAAKSKHEAEVFELKHQLSRLSSLAEKGNQALQQKAQDDKTVAKLSAEIQDAQEILNKHKAESNELRKEVIELRRSLQQSKIEGRCLREELKKAGGLSANPAHFMEEKIQLLKEVERLKLSLQEVEQARVKLLERAKRHQMIHQSNQLKSENELQMLNNMINKVRETLLSLPEVVEKCDQLQLLVEYIG